MLYGRGDGAGDDQRGARHERGIVQHDRSRYRDLHEGSVRDDELRWIGWAPTPVWHLPAQDPSLRTRQAGDHNGAHGTSVVGAGGRDVSHSRSWRAAGRCVCRCDRVRSEDDSRRGDLRGADPLVEWDGVGVRERTSRGAGATDGECVGGAGTAAD